MTYYTKKSIRRAMMEEPCQGLEGHAPLSYDPVGYVISFRGQVLFRCRKCERKVAVFDDQLEREPLSDEEATRALIDLFQDTET